MELKSYLQIATPVIWVKTQESALVYDDILSYASGTSRENKIYRIHPIKGLQSYNKENATWRIVLLKNPEDELVAVGDFWICIKYVHKQRGIFILPNAHKSIDDIVAFVDMLNDDYRSSWFENNADTLPMQLICISNQDCPASELNAVVPSVGVSPPNIDELVGVTSRLVSAAPDQKTIIANDAEVIDVAKAGLGLSESAYRNLITGSYVKFGNIDPTYVLEQKLAQIKQNCGLDIRKPKISLDDIGGLDNIKRTIRLASWAWHNPQEAQEAGVSPLRRMLMVGVPGTGKSAICEAIAYELGVDLAKIGVSQALSKWIGESEQNVRAQFSILKALAPVAAWIDEYGRDFSGGGSSNDSGTTDRVHGEFLTGIQELQDNVFFLAAANNIDGLAPELLRADRFDKIFFVGFPSLDERIQIFKIHLDKFADQFDLEKLAEATPIWTGAEIKGLIKEARFITQSTERRQPTTDEIIQVAQASKNRLWLKRKEYIQAMYRKALNEWEWASREQKADAQLIIGSGNKPSNIGTKVSVQI